MKRLKKILALALAMAMVLASFSLSAFAEETATDGSITVNSPVVGAKYSAYQIFDMTMNAAGDSFSYTIKSNSPFFKDVQKYANASDTTDADGLTLTVTKDTENASVKVYNVSVDETKFNAQAFGKAMRTAVNGTPEVPAETDPKTGDIITPAVPAVEGNGATAIYPDTLGDNPVNVANSELIKFSNLNLGYYLITAVYPDAEYATVTMTPKKYDGSDKDGVDAFTFNKDDLDDEGKLTSSAKTKISSYVNAVVDLDYVNAYVADKDLKHEDGTALTEAEKFTDPNSIMAQLKAAMQADAEAKIQAAFDNQIAGSESDINVKNPIMVFVDSTTPNAVINEKNELDKWDVPVNPSGDAMPKDLPEHGEPDGGKNIVINESPAVYADWSEANIGDSIHYQLRVNAMNFIRKQLEGASEETVNQVKEYFLADYRNPNMHFDTTQGIKVTVVDGNGNNVTVGAPSGKDYLDYSAKADNFFVNGASGASEEYTDGADVLGTNNKNGIMIPWVGITNSSESNYQTILAQHPVYTEYVVESQKEDGNGGTETVKTTYYVYSLYKSDVTIVVDYYMILDNTAVIDGDGNTNYAQYGWNPISLDENDIPEKPSDEDKPSEKETVDDATVKTYALAIHKEDQDGKDLAGAKFKIKGLTVTKKADGWYKVKAYDAEATSFDEADELVTDAKGNLVIEGLMTSATVEIMETEAPEGYNKLDGTVTTSAKKISETVTTTSTKTYMDAQGNVTGKEETNNTETKYYNAAGEVIETAPTGASDSTLVNLQKNLKDVAFKVVNQSGTELPSTGGIGTTIFYVVGAILVIGAGVVLITKRRMEA